jgi:sarcosine oxidase subunit gamma
MVLNIRLLGDAQVLIDRLGLPLPATVNRLRRDGAQFGLRLGPDEWLAVDPSARRRSDGHLQGRWDPGEFEADAAVLVTDVSGAWSLLRVDGPAAAIALSHVARVDVRLLAGEEPRAMQTLVARTPAIVLAAGDSFVVLVRSTYAPWLEARLAIAVLDATGSPWPDPETQWREA